MCVKYREHGAAAICAPLMPRPPPSHGISTSPGCSHIVSARGNENDAPPCVGKDVLCADSETSYDEAEAKEVGQD